MDLSISDVTVEFADGIKLCKLLEVLSGNSLGKLKTGPTMKSGTETTAARRAQYAFRANTEKALEFCAKEGAVRLIISEFAKRFQESVLRMWV